MHCLMFTTCPSYWSLSSSWISRTIVSISTPMNLALTCNIGQYFSSSSSSFLFFLFFLLLLLPLPLPSPQKDPLAPKAEIWTEHSLAGLMEVRQYSVKEISIEISRNTIMERREILLESCPPEGPPSPVTSKPDTWGQSSTSASCPCHCCRGGKRSGLSCCYRLWVIVAWWTNKQTNLPVKVGQTVSDILPVML